MSAADNFTRNKTDAFSVASQELGKLRKARVTVVPKAGDYEGGAWLLEAMHVVRKADASDSRGEPIGSFYGRGWVQPGKVRLLAHRPGQPDPTPLLTQRVLAANHAARGSARGNGADVQRQHSYRALQGRWH